MSQRRAVALLAALAVAAGLAAAGAVAGGWIDPAGIAGSLSLTSADVRRFAAAWGPWAAHGSIALMVLHTVLPLPAEMIAVANGALFGWAGGTAVTWTGAMLGAALSFGIARRLGRPALRRFASERYRRAIEAWEGRPAYLLMVRLIPVISFNLINYAAGMTGVGWWRFLWTTGLGILPITVASVVLGGELLEASWPVWAATGGGIVVLWLVLQRLRPGIVGDGGEDEPYRGTPSVPEETGRGGA
jgi:uncharacterized membrane protein YdjX (TVP38/TMEM64 family)